MAKDGEIRQDYKRDKKYNQVKTKVINIDNLVILMIGAHKITLQLTQYNRSAPLNHAF